MGSFTSDLNAARSGNIDWLASLRSDSGHTGTQPDRAD